MKETFEIIEWMKRDAVIEEYAIAGAVGAIFYIEPFSTEDVDILVNLNPSDGFFGSAQETEIYVRLRCHSGDLKVEQNDARGKIKSLWRSGVVSPGICNWA